MLVGCPLTNELSNIFKGSVLAVCSPRCTQGDDTTTHGNLQKTHTNVQMSDTCFPHVTKMAQLRRGSLFASSALGRGNLM